jgi:type III restriction enzyme
VDEVNLNEFRAKRHMQELVFDLAKTIAREYAGQKQCTIPSHKLFPQLANIIQLYLDKKVEARPPADRKDLFLAPYLGG